MISRTVWRPRKNIEFTKNIVALKPRTPPPQKKNIKKKKKKYIYKLLKTSFAIQVWFIIYHFIFCFQH